ncbi:MAG: DNA-protecting protein DprA [Candidatus Omnitrophica bacterium]|nr:DNA-protecting protein DprA [Candidatus Omnitrophota bacterium]
MTEHDALLILNAISGLGNVRIQALVEFYGSAVQALGINESRLLSDQVVPKDVCQNMVRFAKEDFLKNEYALMAKSNIHAVTYKDEDYPESLKNIVDFPVVLYVKGRLAKDQKLSLAIVGSRKASLYGLSVAEKFATRFAELGITVVSGMARGIDTAAHKGALKARGLTTAVLGSGLAHIYPPENKNLFEEIAQAGGAVVSEYPMDTEPFAYNFPRRNRIISGLSLGVIIVEAGMKSGALITARCALEQGREVYAVPGKIDSPSSEGVNNLIKQGAKLVTSIEDILEDLKTPMTQALKEEQIGREQEKEPLAAAAQNNILNSLSDRERSIYEHLSEEPVHIDDIAQKSGLASSCVIAVLMQLELKRLVKQLPGKHFKR